MNQIEKNKIDVHSLQEDQKEFIKNNKLILKTQQRYRSEKDVLTEGIKWLPNDDKRIQSIDSVETYAYGMSKDLVYLILKWHGKYSLKYWI